MSIDRTGLEKGKIYRIEKGDNFRVYPDQECNYHHSLPYVLEGDEFLLFDIADSRSSKLKKLFILCTNREICGWTFTNNYDLFSEVTSDDDHHHHQV